MSLDVNNNTEDNKILTSDEHQFKKNLTYLKNCCEVEDIIVPIKVFNERRRFINQLVHFLF